MKINKTKPAKIITSIPWGQIHYWVIATSAIGKQSNYRYKRPFQAKEGLLKGDLEKFQRRSRKCLSQSEARAAILSFRPAGKTQTW